jgi:hypothetical protein
MQLRRQTGLLLFVSVFAAGPTLAATLKADQPVSVGGVETVCTGSSVDARSNPQWRDYSLRLEFVGEAGQYLGDEQVDVKGHGESLGVHCAGPWVLMNLPEGYYIIATSVAEVSHKDIIGRVPASGQFRLIVRFPDTGGIVTMNSRQPGILGF